MKALTKKEIIENEVSSWNFEKFTDATFDEIVQDILYNVENGYSLEEAYEHTNQAIAEGNF